MEKARQIMDVYTGSDESEQFDMWFANRELRTQFEAIDHILEIRRRKGFAGLRDGGFWNRLAKVCPRHAHPGRAGA